MIRDLKRVVTIGMCFNFVVYAIYTYKVATLWIYLTSNFGLATTQVYYGAIVIIFRLASLLTNSLNMWLTRYPHVFTTRRLLLAAIVVERVGNWLYLFPDISSTFRERQQKWLHSYPSRLRAETIGSVTGGVGGRSGRCGMVR